MTFNPTAMIQQKVRSDFELLLATVSGEAGESGAADEMERYLFKQLLNLGRNLLQLYVDIRSERYPRQAMRDGAGRTIPYHSDKGRDYLTIFGGLVIRRPYFYSKETRGCSPLDGELGLGEDVYSDYLREVQDELSVHLPYEKGIAFLERLLDIGLSKRCVQQLVQADAADAAAYYEQKPAPPVEEEAAILVVQADGKGIPIIKASPNQGKTRLQRGQARSQKKAVTVTAHYTIAPAPRSVEAVLDSLLADKKQAPPSARSGPQHKQLWGTLQGKATALDRLQSEVSKREGDHIHHRVMLCDGDPSLQTQLQERFPHFTLILDFIHVYERLWQVANSLYGQDSPDRWPWVRSQTRCLLEGQAATLVTTFRQLAQQRTCSASQQAILHKAANYYETNQSFMDYTTYLAKGWPIASGVIEGACRHFVKDRLELSGMRWSVDGAESLLHLRAVAENNDWQAFHRFRQQRRQQRLYQRDWPPQLNLPTLFQPRIPPTQPAYPLNKPSRSSLRQTISRLSLVC